jgi:hypothetical protein
MKKVLLTLFIASISTALSAQTDSTNAIDTINTAKIYIIRSTGHVGSAVNLRITVNDSMYCKIKNNRYAVFYIAPGEHIFYASSWDSGTDEKLGMKLTVEAGKTYYLSMKMKQRFFKNEIFVEEITYNTAAPQLEKYKQDGCN